MTGSTARPGIRAAAMALALLCLLVATAAGALEVPFLSGHVNDLAGVLSEADSQRLEGQLVAFEDETGTQIAVLTISSLEGDDLEDFSLRVAETWELGREESDDGVLFLVAQGDRKMRIEVGYGLEGALTDAMSRRILDNIVGPRFRNGDFASGIEEGVGAIMALVRGEAPPPELQEPTDLPAPLGCLVSMLPFLIVLAILAFFHVISGRFGSRGGWSSSGSIPWVITSGSGGGSSWGGSSGGDFGGFSGGGGSFGGGGASSSW